jgi:hypothetical protein
MSVLKHICYSIFRTAWAERHAKQQMEVASLVLFDVDISYQEAHQQQDAVRERSTLNAQQSDRDIPIFVHVDVAICMYLCFVC